MNIYERAHIDKVMTSIGNEIRHSDSFDTSDSDSDSDSNKITYYDRYDEKTL